MESPLHAGRVASSSGATRGAETPLVTVCIPTIGRLQYLDSTFESLRAQHIGPLEVLVLDNASPPEAAEVVARYAGAIPDARVMRLSERVSMFPNFNRGIREARGKYVTFFHDDDFYAPSFLEHFVGLLEANPRAVFAGGNFSIIDGEGRVVRQHNRIRETGYWSGRRFIEDLIQRGRSTLPTPGIVFRRDIFQEGGFDESLPFNWGDFPIFMRMAERGDIAVSAEVHYAWRVHGNNNSNIPFSQSIPVRTKVVDDYIDEYRARHPEDDAFIQRLEHHAERSRRLGLLWGWTTATSEEDAAACLRLLEPALPPGSTAVLKTIDRVGMSLARRRSMTLRVRDSLQRVKQ